MFLSVMTSHAGIQLPFTWLPCTHATDRSTRSHIPGTWFVESGGHNIERGSRWSYCRERLPGGFTVESGSPVATLVIPPGAAPWCMAVESGSPVALPSRAVHRWPYRRERFTGGLTVESGSPVALPSRAFHRWPYRREHFTGGLTVESISPVALPSRAFHRWPYRREHQNIKEIEKVQRRQARCVKNINNRESRVTEMVKDVKWEPLERRREISRIVL